MGSSRSTQQLRDSKWWNPLLRATLSFQCFLCSAVYWTMFVLCILLPMEYSVVQKMFCVRFLKSLRTTYCTATGHSVLVVGSHVTQKQQNTLRSRRHSHGLFFHRRNPCRMAHWPPPLLKHTTSVSRVEKMCWWWRGRCACWSENQPCLSGFPSSPGNFAFAGLVLNENIDVA